MSATERADGPGSAPGPIPQDALSTTAMDVAARQVPLQRRRLPLKLLRETTEVQRAVRILHDPGCPSQARRAIPEPNHGLSRLRPGIPLFFRHVSNWLTDI
jgi:hypothetical protein